ncbi:MAG: serine hydrolase domain-containing protein, partial [Verrucomicrobiota bacterium]|nr:serine hydrolase domain-containing protein [Verrucomicrobiota bacterium]
FDYEKLQEIGEAVSQAQAEGHLPGAVVWIEHRSTAYTKAFGKLSEKPTLAIAQDDSIYDLASLTKVVATTSAILRLWEQGKLSLDDPVAKHLPPFSGMDRNSITVRHLLTHTSGLRPDISLAGWNGHDECIARCCAEKPRHAPGTVFIYSDINFQLLDEIVRRLSGKRLDTFCEKEIFRPLKMTDTGYNPPTAKRNRIAPTTREGDNWLRGVVHDPRARKTGGVAGHAGLFSTAPDLARFCRMILNGGMLDGIRVFKKETVAEWTRIQSPDQKDAKGRPAQRALGWDVGSVYNSPRGRLFPHGSFGHSGFTGTSMWIDPLSKTFVIFLCNRLHPDGKGNVIKLRKHIGTLAAESLLQYDFGPPRD